MRTFRIDTGELSLIKTSPGFQMKTYLNSQGEAHRDGDLPAVVMRKGDITGIGFKKNGKIHRDTGPALVTRMNGKTVLKVYATHGKLLRAETYENGILVRKTDWENPK